MIRYLMGTLSIEGLSDPEILEAVSEVNHSGRQDYLAVVSSQTANRVLLFGVNPMPELAEKTGKRFLVTSVGLKIFIDKESFLNSVQESFYEFKEKAGPATIKNNYFVKRNLVYDKEPDPLTVPEVALETAVEAKDENELSSLMKGVF